MADELIIGVGTILLMFGYSIWKSSVGWEIRSFNSATDKRFLSSTEQPDPSGAHPDSCSVPSLG